LRISARHSAAKIAGYRIIGLADRVGVLNARSVAEPIKPGLYLCRRRAHADRAAPPWPNSEPRTEDCWSRPDPNYSVRRSGGQIGRPFKGFENKQAAIALLSMT